MKLCQTCWDKLKEGIKEEGFDYLIARGGEAAVKNIAKEIEDGANKDNFDPLMAANMMIWNNCLDQAVNPIAVIQYDDCCYCLLVDSCTCGNKENCAYKKWIEFAVRDACAEARKFGFKPIKENITNAE